MSLAMVLSAVILLPVLFRRQVVHMSRFPLKSLWNHLTSGRGPWIMTYIHALYQLYVSEMGCSQEQLRKESGEQVYQPGDFALLLEGFPPDATDEDEIANFVCSSLLLNQPKESVVKVVIGFDTRHYEEHIRLRESLKGRLDRAIVPEAKQGTSSAESILKLVHRVEQDTLRYLFWFHLACPPHRHFCTKRRVT